MKYFFSKSRKGFFIEGVSSSIPEDSLEISEQNYREIFEAQSNGKQISINDEGYPIIVDFVDLPEDVVLQSVRDERNRLLKESDWTQLPDIPEALKTVWAQYRQNLRDVPQQPGFPQNVVWPEKPV